MKIAEYARLSRRTVAPLSSSLHESHMQAGIITEFAELIDAFKKTIAYNKPLDLVNISEEIGDIAFYIAGMIHEEVLNDPAMLSSVIENNLFIQLSKEPNILVLQKVLKNHNIDFKNFDQPVKELSLTNHAKLDCLIALFIQANYSHVKEFFLYKTIDLGNTSSVLQLLGILDIVAYLLDVNLDQCLENNIIKLQKRYPEKFNSEKALNRDIENELNHF